MDYDSIAAIVAAAVAGGSGDFPESLFVYDSLQDAIVVAATVAVKNTDTSAYAPSTGPQRTDVFGKAVFNLDAATYPVAVKAQGYFQASAYQLVTVAGPGGRDTVFVYSYVFIPPTGSDSTLIVCFTNDPNATAIISIIETDGNQDTSGVALTSYVDVATADMNGTIQFSLPRTAGTRQKTQWRIDVKDSFNKTMISVPKYIVPNQAIDTLLVPLKNQ